MAIIKVNIQTGEVMENNLREFWARESMRSGHKAAEQTASVPRHSRPARRQPPQKIEQTLMERVKKFSSKVNKKSNSWRDEELYQLAVFMSRKKMPYRQIGQRLAKSPKACKYMYWRMKKEGVI